MPDIKCPHCGSYNNIREVVTRCLKCNQNLFNQKTENMKRQGVKLNTEGAVTISIKEYEELKNLSDNYIDKCFQLAQQIHRDWAKSEVYWEAIKRKEAQNETKNEIFLKEQIEHWKSLYLSLKEKVKIHNEKFYTFNKIKL